MTEPREVVELMLQKSHALDRMLSALDAAANEKTDAVHAYKQAYAAAYKASTGTVGEREAEATLAVGPLEHRAEKAKDGLANLEKKMRYISDEMSVLQSAAGFLREEARFARVGDGP